MSKIVRRVSLASLLLLIFAIGSYYVGEWQAHNEIQQFEKYMAASGYYMSDVSPDSNFWQVTGFLLFFASIAVGIAAFMLWRQDKHNRR